MQSPNINTIINSVQRDDYQILDLYNHILNILNRLFGVNISFYSEEIQSLVKILYHGLHLLSEQYFSMVLSDTYSFRPASLLSRISIFLIEHIIPFLCENIQKIFSLFSLNFPHSNIIQSLFSIMGSFLIILQRFHFIIFLLTGTYLTLGHRLNNLKYFLFKTKNNSNHQPYSFLWRVLGLLMLIEFFIIIFRRILKYSSQSVPDIQTTSLLHEPLPTKALCTLCLQSRAYPTVTECGHVFCWKCISNWCQIHPTCPICRQSSRVSRLLRLCHYA